MSRERPRARSAGRTVDGLVISNKSVGGERADPFSRGEAEASWSRFVAVVLMIYSSSWSIGDEVAVEMSAWICSVRIQPDGIVVSTLGQRTAESFARLQCHVDVGIGMRYRYPTVGICM